MSRLLLMSFIVVAILFAYQQISYAACVQGPLDTFTCNTNPPNPDPNGIQQAGNDNNLTVNVIPGAGIDTRIASGGNGLDGIRTANGNDMINVDDAEVFAEDDAIHARGGDNTINITDSEVYSLKNIGISAQFGGNNIVHVLNSDIRSMEDDGIGLDSGNDLVEIHGSVVGPDPGSSPGDTGVRTGGGNDQVIISDSLILAAGSSMLLGNGNDIVTLGTDAELKGSISCGADFDTIVFAMDVPQSDVLAITAQINSKNPSGDSITINGLFYEWADCESLVADLNGIVTSVPTLSEWGLIAMSGLLGIAGFMVIRRRKVAA